MILYCPCRFTPYIADAVPDQIREEFSDGSVFSVLYDGATDTGVMEVEIIHIRIARNGEVKEFFCALEDLEHAHAEGIYQAVERALDDSGIENIGQRNSVATRLSHDKPYLVIGHCVCHRLELAAQEGIKDDPMLLVIQDMLKKLHKRYHYSPKALRELREIADALDEKIIKPTRLQGTRWIPHMNKSTKTLPRIFPVLVAHFEHVGEAGPGQATAEVRGRGRFPTTKLRDFRVLRFMFFFRDVLDILSRFFDIVSTLFIIALLHHIF